MSGEQGGLPEGWDEAPIGQFLVVQRGGSPRPIKSFLTDDPHGLNWIKIGDVAPGSKYITSTKERIIQEGLTKTRMVYEGDLLLSNSMSFGRPYILQIQGCIHDGWLVLRQPRENRVDQEFLYHWLSTPQVYSRLSNIAKGSTVRNLNSEIVRKVQVTVPPLNEQRRIVAKIESLQARSEAAKEALDAIPPLLEKFRQSVLAAAFRGDLTASWRAKNPDVEPASVLLERIRAERRTRWIADAAEKGRARAEARARKAGKPWTAADDAKVLDKERVKAAKKYKAPEPVDASELPTLPDGWCWAWLSDCGEVARGKSKHRPRNDARLFGNEFPFIQTGEVARSTGRISTASKYYSDFGLAQSRLFPVGTVCITIAANIADTAILDIEACFPDSVVGVVPDSGLLPAELIEFYIRTVRDDLNAVAPATAQKNINLAVLSQVAVPVPPAAEQPFLRVTIAESLEIVLSLMQEHSESESLLTRLNQSILAKAFRGELVPQDPTDEPASVLLERIRAEREAAEAAKKAAKRRRRVNA